MSRIEPAACDGCRHKHSRGLDLVRLRRSIKRKPRCRKLDPARRVTITAFLCDFLWVILFQLTLVSPSFSTSMAQSALEAVFGSTPRILAASFTAYVAGSLSNAKIMELMHMHDGEKRLAWRCIASTIVGETLDMTVFTLLAFTGVLPWPVIGQMIVVASAIKVAVECICYPLVTSHVIAWAKTLE
ncbi:MAG: queuosine precursor transporter [Atopobiaceae bacterium]|nr:queuosine precursor transporter [Atopobiaceae bacterium]